MSARNVSRRHIPDCEFRCNHQTSAVPYPLGGLGLFLCSCQAIIGFRAPLMGSRELQKAIEEAIFGAKVRVKRPSR